MGLIIQKLINGKNDGKINEYMSLICKSTFLGTGNAFSNENDKSCNL